MSYRSIVDKNLGVEHH